MATTSELQFVAHADTRDRLSPQSLLEPIADLGRGLGNRSAILSPFVLQAGPGFSVAVDPWIIYENLGQFAIVRGPFASETFKIPDPVDVLPYLEYGRKQWLLALRMPPEQLPALVTGTTQATPEALIKAVRLSTYAYLTMINVLMLYIRNRWQILPVPGNGVLAGLAEEIDLWSAHLPEPDQRHPESQAVLERFTVEVERLIGRRAVHMPAAPLPPAVAGTRARELKDAARLEWYFAHPAFVEIRGLRSNRYHYLALLFNGQRVVVDTAQKENRFFLWEGPLTDILDAIEAALSGTQIKQTMEQHRLCVGAHEHDDEGRSALARFLE